MSSRTLSLRESMVERQIRARGVRDGRVLEAMREIPRHRFVPDLRPEQAYSDGPHAIGHRQTISQPFMVALMTELLEIEGGETVLEIGTGSGYQTAVLLTLGARVFTIERIPELAERAVAALASLGITNFRSRVGDGTLGWPSEAPFDRIIVTAGARQDPRILAEQLAPEGILLAPIGPLGGQELIRIRRTGEGITTRESHCHCAFVRLIGEDSWPEESP